jgi:ethanolamine utilization microcompartment shell protein EutL
MNSPKPTVDAVDKGKAFDHQVRQAQRHLMLEAESRPMSELAMMLGADVGSAQAAMLNDDMKAALAFLIRAAAVARFLVSDREEFADEITDLMEDE